MGTIPTRKSVRRHQLSGQNRRLTSGESIVLSVAVLSRCEASPPASCADMFAILPLICFFQGVDRAYASQVRAWRNVFQVLLLGGRIGRTTCQQPVTPLSARSSLVTGSLADFERVLTPAGSILIARNEH